MNELYEADCINTVDRGTASGSFRVNIYEEKREGEDINSFCFLWSDNQKGLKFDDTFLADRNAEIAACSIHCIDCPHDGI